MKSTHGVLSHLLIRLLNRLPIRLLIRLLARLLHSLARSDALFRSLARSLPCSWDNQIFMSFYQIVVYLCATNNIHLSRVIREGWRPVAADLFALC